MATTRALDITGQTFGRLTVLSRADNVGKHAAWVSRCECGVEKVVQARHLKTGDVASCGCLKREHAAAVAAAARLIYRAEVPTYTGAHMRVRAERGSASGWPCVDCGGAAEEWSYTGTDPDELKGSVGLYVLAYSKSPEYYEARCRKCHKAYDSVELSSKTTNPHQANTRCSLTGERGAA